MLFNAGEPTNSLSMWGIEGPDGSVHAVGCRLSGRLNDGPAPRAILPNDGGTLVWFNGDEEGAGLVLRRATSAVHFVVLAG